MFPSSSQRHVDGVLCLSTLFTNRPFSSIKIKIFNQSLFFFALMPSTLVIISRTVIKPHVHNDVRQNVPMVQVTSSGIISFYGSIRNG